MEMQILTLVAVFVAIALVILGIPIAYVLLICAVFAMVFGLGPSVLVKLGVTPFASFFSLTWTTLPLFILLSCIINETAIAQDIFIAANNWTSHIRGGLVISSIIAEAIMAAAIGASGITLLAVGKVALPEMDKLNYKRNFSAGAILAGGVLGPLIPPSIAFVVYGALTQTSISKLLIAGIMPGILLTIMLSVWAMITSIRHPLWAPLPEAVSWKDRFYSLRKIWPILLIMVGIIGSIYAGIATATEAAAVGSILALLIAIVSYRFRIKQWVRAMGETATTTAMITIMILAATVFSFSVGASGLANDIAVIITNAGFTPWMLIIAINIIILILGCIMDTLAIVLVTVPIFVPIIVALGFNPVWFGVVMVVNTEIGLITPPIGLNIFIASQVFRISIIDLLRGVAPFLVVLIVFLAIVVAFPQLSLWLPNMMKA